MAQARILVTGGAGFIGSHLCDRLVESGADVLCLDNFLTGSKKNVAHLLSRPNFELIRHDVVEPFLAEVDLIYNLACPSSPRAYQANAVKTVKTSVMGAINMLGLAKRLGARILQASSSDVYGDPKQHPQKESYWGYVDILSKRACHDEGKRVAETLMMDYHIQNKVEVRIARIFNTYGPRMAPDDGRVVTSFIVRALKNEPLVVFGDGSQVRTFCHVSDMVEGLVRLMEKDGFTGPVNLGNPREATVKQLARTILDITGSSSKIQYAPLPETDPVRRAPDISLARKTLGWEPGVSLTKGLTELTAHFEKLMRTKQ